MEVFNFNINKAKLGIGNDPFSYMEGGHSG
jgi:hypothetical protein